VRVVTGRRSESIAQIAYLRLAAARSDWFLRPAKVPGKDAPRHRVQIGHAPGSYVWITERGTVRMSSGVPDSWRADVEIALGELFDRPVQHQEQF